MACGQDRRNSTSLPRFSFLCPFRVLLSLVLVLESSQDGDWLSSVFLRPTTSSSTTVYSAFLILYIYSSDTHSLSYDWTCTVAFGPSLSSKMGSSLGSGGPAHFHPRRNISGFVDLALERATAPAGKDCTGVDLSHASLYISSSFRFRLSSSSTLAGRGSWAVLTTCKSPVARRPSGWRSCDVCSKPGPSRSERRCL